MKKEIYYCDQCKKEKDKEELQEISIKIGRHYESGSRHYKDLELCISCAEKLGIIKRVIKKDEIVNEVQDVKDKLFDIVQQIIREAGVQIEY